MIKLKIKLLKHVSRKKIPFESNNFRRCRVIQNQLNLNNFTENNFLKI